MKEYLVKTSEYWQKGYEAENVESFVFRFYGRVLRDEFGLDGSKNEKLLDFGCGSGAALKFFKTKGFNAYGVDISQIDIERCKQKMPDIKDHFVVISPIPSEKDCFFDGGFSLVIAIQSLYYYSDTDLRNRLISLYNQMAPGGLIYATMIGTKCYYFSHSKEENDGLSRVELSTHRFKLHDYYMNFTFSEEDLLKKFSLFKKCHIGYYDAKYREDEGSDFHYTFLGQKA